MKKIVSLLLLLFFFNCKTSVTEESKSIIITSAQMSEMVSSIASDEYNGRLTGTEDIEKAATYIENQFKGYGVKPYFETYRNHFKAKDLDAFNVVGFIEGNDSKLKNEVIILSAHYDHIGYGEGIKKYQGRLTENDSLANGANDNATGTSTVLAMANYFAAKKNNKRSLMFVLFSAEELGLLGSTHLAEKLKAQNIDLYTMVNFEMTGVPFKDRDFTAFISGYELSNMAEKMNEYIGSNLIGFYDVAKQMSLFKRSDNYPFYQQFNIPAQTISSCDLPNYPYYHHVDDEAEKLDYEHMASLINKIIPGIEKMSNTPTKEIKMHE